MRNAMAALASVLPNAEHRTLAGQTHMIKAAVHAPVITEFLLRAAADTRPSVLT
jgi:hypothetical protein